MIRLVYPRNYLFSFSAALLIVTSSFGGDFFRNEPDGVTFFPGWQRVVRAARHAITDPGTWFPAAAATGVYCTKNDKPLSGWATTRNPLFGSPVRAAEASDILLNGTIIAYFASVIARLGLSEPQWSLYPAAAGLFWGLSAEGITGGFTDAIKSGTGRLRPNGHDRLSFPSGHASSAAVTSALACSNIEMLPIRKPLLVAMKSGVMLMSMGTAWARVEAKRHYPSDVLAGAALGNLIGIFINDAFIGTKSPVTLGVHVSTSKANRGAGITLSIPLRN